MPGCILCGSLGPFSIYELPQYESHCQSADQRCPACMAMVRLEDQISKAKDALVEMLSQHRKLRTQMNHSHDRMIHRLPPEISSFIFQLCVPHPRPHEFASESNFTKQEIYAPLSLGAVCRTWRQIAWSSPQLWNFISIRHGRIRSSAKSEIVKEWLDRSGRLPLSIQYYSRMPAFDPLIDVVNQYSSRWQHLYIDAPRIVLPLFCGDSYGLSILQTLHLKSYHQTGSRLSREKFAVGNVVPRPLNVLLYELPFEKVNIEWNNVTCLRAGNQDVGECIEVVRRAPQLIYCDLKDLTFSPNLSTDPVKPIIHNRIRVLNLDLLNYNGSIFFDKMTLPALENFSLRTFNIFLPIDSLVSFLQRSCFHLTTFKLSFNTSIDPDDFLRILQTTTTLHELHLDEVSKTTSEILVRLLASSPSASIENPGGKRLLPALQSLIFTSKSRFPWTVVPFIFGPPSKIRTRLRRPLRKLEIVTNQDEYIEKGIVSYFLELIKFGVSLNVRNKVDGSDWLKMSMAHHGILDS